MIGCSSSFVCRSGARWCTNCVGWAGARQMEPLGGRDICSPNSHALSREAGGCKERDGSARMLRAMVASARWRIENKRGSASWRSLLDACWGVLAPSQSRLVMFAPICILQICQKCHQVHRYKHDQRPSRTIHFGERVLPPSCIHSRECATLTTLPTSL